MSPSNHLTRAILADLQTYWFRACPTLPGAGIPAEITKRWFVPSTDVDDHCRKEYGPAAEAALQLSIAEIRQIAQEPVEEVAAVILLDQIPRNIYRGKDAHKAYRQYDPKALELAKTLLGEGYGFRAKFPSFAHSMFLYLPLMHSENIADHDLSASLLKQRRNESDSAEEINDIDNVVEFEENHRRVLEKFGRYPSRNHALGRESTKEEVEHIAQGPGW